SLSYALPPELRDLRSFRALSLRVAQTNSDVNPVRLGQEFVVELLGEGRSQAYSIVRFGEIPVPYRHPFLEAPHNVMTTVRLPLGSFIAGPDGPPLSNIDTIRLRFAHPLQGDIY